jgi:hypothetical protein
MGKPKTVDPSLVNTNYDWGEFGSANENGVNLSPVANMSVRSAQSGINQYVNELINPSYDNVSFKARQDLLDANNRQYANQLGAAAISRGARGSATQNILNSIMANRNNDMRGAMTSEDQRVQNILSALSGIEGNYWQQSNAMAGNILDRARIDAAAENAANTANTNAYNAWRNNIISGVASVAGGVIGGPMGAALAGSLAKSALGNGQVTDVNGNVIGQVGGYGTYDPDFKQY